LDQLDQQVPLALQAQPVLVVLLARLAPQAQLALAVRPDQLVLLAQPALPVQLGQAEPQAQLALQDPPGRLDHKVMWVQLGLLV
jgi:hypothetical protein